MRFTLTARKLQHEPTAAQNNDLILGLTHPHDATSLGYSADFQIPEPLSHFRIRPCGTRMQQARRHSQQVGSPQRFAAVLRRSYKPLGCNRSAAAPPLCSCSCSHLARRGKRRSIEPARQQPPPPPRRSHIRPSSPPHSFIAPRSWYRVYRVAESQLSAACAARAAPLPASPPVCSARRTSTGAARGPAKLPPRRPVSPAGRQRRAPPSTGALVLPTSQAAECNHHNPTRGAPALAWMH